MRHLSYLLIFVITCTYANVDETRLATENERNTISIVKGNINSVVHVSNIQIKRAWGYGKVEIPAGAGTGWVFDLDGHIVTNYHVIHEGDSFMVSFHKDGKQYKAKVVGGEPKKDIAVLKLLEKPANLKPLVVGESASLLVGQKAVAIGNPFGLDHTVTQGIISAIDREIEGFSGLTIKGMIQTDAAINPGNSGGPLFDSSGKVIGVNTVIYSRTGTSAGVGFAVPIDTVKRIVPQIIKYGRVIQPGLGIGILPDEYKQTYFGIKEGIVITYMDDDGPAARAGLKGMSQDFRGRYYVGDVIIAINGKEVSSMNDIYQQLENYQIGQEVEVTYSREGKTKKVKIKLTDVGANR